MIARLAFAGPVPDRLPSPQAPRQLNLSPRSLLALGDNCNKLYLRRRHVPTCASNRSRLSATQGGFVILQQQSPIILAPVTLRGSIRLEERRAPDA